MKINLPPNKPDPLLDWHEWFAWHPVIAHERGYFTVQNLKANAEYLIWWRYVMRRKVIIDSTVQWLYEER